MKKEGEVNDISSGKPKLKVLEYLQNHHTLEDLEREFSIKVVPHQAFPDLYLLSYRQTSSPLEHEIVQECRGMIIERSKNQGECPIKYRVVCFPYIKFFNYNEQKMVKGNGIDWKDNDAIDFYHGLRVFEKFDGSMVALYYYGNQWNVSSSGTPDGSGTIGFTMLQHLSHQSSNNSTMMSNTFNGLSTEDSGNLDHDNSPNAIAMNAHQGIVKFSDLFWQIWKERGYTLPGEEDQSKCFIFEMVTQRHILVVQYKQDDIILHGVRCLKSLEELDHIPFGSKYNWNYAKPLYTGDQIIKLLDGQNLVDKNQYQGSQSIECLNDSVSCKLQSKQVLHKERIIDFLEKETEKMNPTECEGFVICDSKFNRIKLKSAMYVKLSHLMFDSEESTTKNLIIILQRNEGKEYLSYFPKFKSLYNQYEQIYDRICSYVRFLYSEIIKSVEMRDYQAGSTGQHLSPAERNKLFACEMKSNQKFFLKEKIISDVLFKMYKDGYPQRKSERDCFAEMQKQRFLNFFLNMKKYLAEGNDFKDQN